MTTIPPSFVQGEYHSETKTRVRLISVLHFKVGMKHGEATYLAVVIKIKSGVTQVVPDVVAKLLSKFEDMMPPNLPKELLVKGRLITRLSWCRD